MLGMGGGGVKEIKNHHCYTVRALACYITYMGVISGVVGVPLMSSKHEGKAANLWKLCDVQTMGKNAAHERCLFRDDVTPEKRQTRRASFSKSKTATGLVEGYKNFYAVFLFFLFSINYFHLYFYLIK